MDSVDLHSLQGFLPFIFLFLFFVFALSMDWILNATSNRLSLFLGHGQIFLFNYLGRNSFIDIAIASLWQWMSLRKKAFFTQIATFVHVNSFNRKQIILIFMGSFIGLGLSIFLLTLVHLSIILALLFFGFFIRFIKIPYGDLGWTFLGLGFFLLLVVSLDQIFVNLSFLPYILTHILEDSVWPFWILVFVSSLMFTTPIGFILTLSLFHFLVGLEVSSLPLAYFIYGLCTSTWVVLWFFRSHRRLRYFLFMGFVLQLIQLLLVYVSLFFYKSQVESIWISIWEQKNFLDSYLFFCFGFVVYFCLPFLLLSPFFVYLLKISFFSEAKRKRTQSQKILLWPSSSPVFSIDFSIFFLRQEFLKLATLSHTIFKMGREIGTGQEEKVEKKLQRYQAVIVRVSKELKTFCFQSGTQNCYKSHLEQIFNIYKSIHHLNLLVENLFHIFYVLENDSMDGEWKRECRYWLSLQLLVFESFFNRLLGLDVHESQTIKDSLQKSYDLLQGSFLNGLKGGGRAKFLPPFYRLLEVNHQLTSIRPWDK